MYRTAICALGILLASCSKPPSMTYPQTTRGAVVEAQFGEQVADPFRWLENDVRTDPQVETWVNAENRVTYDYLDTLPGRDALQERLSQLWNYERFGVPEKAGENYFYSHNAGLQNQSVLYRAHRARRRTARAARPEHLGQRRGHRAGRVAASPMTARSSPSPCRTAAPTGASSRYWM